MLAMHYQFTLPADYDMRIIRGRVAARGQSFEGMAGLVFKQFLLADVTAGAPSNRYAPVYVWASAGAAHDFLRGPLFAALSTAFGRPRVAIGLLNSLPGRAAVTTARALDRRIEIPALLPSRTIASQTPPAATDTLAWDEPQDWNRVTMALDPGPAMPGERFEIAFLARGAEWERLP